MNVPPAPSPRPSRPLPPPPATPRPPARTSRRGALDPDGGGTAHAHPDSHAATLQLDGQINNTVLSVASGAALLGSGTILGTTTIAGEHAPGSSPGIQTLGNPTYLSGASAPWELWNNTIVNTSTPLDYDQIMVTGNLDFSGQTTFELLFSGSAGPTNFSEVA